MFLILKIVFIFVFIFAVVITRQPSRVLIVPPLVSSIRWTRASSLCTSQPFMSSLRTLSAWTLPAWVGWRAWVARSTLTWTSRMAPPCTSAAWWSKGGHYLEVSTSSSLQIWVWTCVWLFFKGMITVAFMNLFWRKTWKSRVKEKWVVFSPYTSVFLVFITIITI